MESIEYKLKGNEFKVLQLLKTIQKPISYRELSLKTNITERCLRDIIRILHGFHVIEKENIKGTNKYIVNEYKNWIVQ